MYVQLRDSQWQTRILNWMNVSERLELSLIALFAFLIGRECASRRKSRKNGRVGKAALPKRFRKHFVRNKNERFVRRCVFVTTMAALSRNFPISFPDFNHNNAGRRNRFCDSIIEFFSISLFETKLNLCPNCNYKWIKFRKQCAPKLTFLYEFSMQTPLWYCSA